MKASRLRDLARQYATKSIGRDEYLTRRTELIDGIVAGEIEIHHHERNSSQRRDKTRMRRSRKHRFAVLLLAVLLLVVVVAYIRIEWVNAPSAQGRTAPPRPETGIEDFTAFLQDNDWSEPSLSQLEARWRELSAFERESVRRSQPYRKLKNATLQRIREQEALIAAGEMPALLRAARLRDFSRLLGFEKARLDNETP